MPRPRDLVTWLLLVTMEVTAGFAAVVGTGLLGIASLPYRSFWLFLLVSYIAVAATLLLNAFITSETKLRVPLLGAGGILAIGAALLTTHSPPAFLAALVLFAVVYARAITVAQEPPQLEEVHLRFAFGFTVFLFAVVWAVAREALSQQGAGYILALLGIGFTIASMAALAVARMADRREAGATASAVLAISAQLGLLVLAGLLALQFFAFDIAGLIGNATKPFWDVVGPFLGKPFELIGWPVSWLIDLLRGAGSGKPLHLHPPSRGPAVHPQHGKHHVNTGWLIFLLVIGSSMTVAILVGLAVVLWNVVPRGRRRRRAPERPEGYREEKRVVWSFRRSWSSFLAWLRLLFRRGAAAARTGVRGAERRLRGPTYPSDPVRRVYAQLLARAEAAGLTRPPATTPLEFRKALISRWPQADYDVSAITEAYVLRRYADLEFQPSEVEGLKRNWQHARDAMRRRKAPGAAR